MRLFIASRPIMLLVMLALSLFSSDVVAQVAQPVQGDTCDPIVSGLASIVVPGWGQGLNDEPTRKWLIHFTVGLGSTLAMIYRWNAENGGMFRTIRILWSAYSGIEAFSTCYARVGTLAATAR